MATHGDILILNEDDKREDGIWLHAYSNGHTTDAFEMLSNLPEWFVERAKLANQLNDSSIGKGWFIDQFTEQHWKHCLCIDIGSYKSTIAALMCARYLDRWMPIQESDAPWHEVGEHPDITVICRKKSYDLISNDEELELGTVTIEWMNRLFEGFKAAKKTF